MTIINIYPNPAKDNIYLDFMGTRPENILVSMYSAIGQEVFKEHFNGEHGNIIELNMSELPMGIYSVIIKSGKDNSFKQVKIIKL